MRTHAAPSQASPVRRWTLAATLLVVNGFLQIADVATTVAILSAGGAEGNPVSQAVMHHGGIGLWIVIKILIAMALMMMVLPVINAERRNPRTIHACLTLFTGLMAVVLLNNGLIIYEHVL